MATECSFAVDDDQFNDDALRISSIFVIFICSFLGTCLPVYASHRKHAGVPEWILIATKYFGSGVILATAFIHLLAPAHEALTNPCLTGLITEYDWTEGICLITIFALFVVELWLARAAAYLDQKQSYASSESYHNRIDDRDNENDTDTEEEARLFRHDKSPTAYSTFRDHTPTEEQGSPANSPNVLHHQHDEDNSSRSLLPIPNSHSHSTDTHKTHPFLNSHLTSLTILESGIVLHSLFIGVTLSLVPTSQFPTLYLVLVLHQTFEGLALGAQLSEIPWSSSPSRSSGVIAKRRIGQRMPYILALLYALSTPMAVAGGLVLRASLLGMSTPGAGSAVGVVNGVFDAVSAGILIYSALVELMAREVIGDGGYLKTASVGKVARALGWMLLGAGGMAILGIWA